MYVSALTVRGLRDLEEFTVRDLPRVATVRGPSPASTALGDALELAFSSLCSDQFESLLRRWELMAPGETLTIDGDPFPDQATWNDRIAARCLLSEGGSRSVTVEVELILDPPLFQALRTLGFRDLNLLCGLSI